MTEKQYKKLLKTLGIGSNKSNAEVKELLDAKLNEYLDRTDADAEQKVSDIQDALDYVEDLIEKMGGGIALPPVDAGEKDDADEVNQKALGQAAKKVKREAATYTSSAGASGQNTGVGQGTSTGSGVNPKGKAWYYSLYGDQKVDDMFEMAEGDLMQGDFQHADAVFDMILKVEVVNPGAYMGKVLSTYKEREPKDIATCYKKGLENDSNLKRIENCGNEKQKKFIADALEERRKGMIYMEADKTLQMRDSISSLNYALTQFNNLGSYRDAVKKVERCKEEIDRLKKELEEKRLREQKERERREEERRKKEEEKRKEIRRKEKERIRKRILGGVAGVWLLCAVVNWLEVYNGTGGIGIFFPNVWVMHEEWFIADTPSPYFISLVPMSGLNIWDSAPNLETVIMPFGATEISYDKPMKKVNLPNRVKRVELNCQNLESLEIPEGVKILILSNIPSEWTDLEIPDSVNYLYIEGITSELAQKLEIDSLKRFYIEGYDKEVIMEDIPLSIDDPEEFKYKIERMSDYDSII